MTPRPKWMRFYKFHLTLLLRIIVLFLIQLQLFAALRLNKLTNDFAYVPVEYSFDTLMEEMLNTLRKLRTFVYRACVVN